jgi:hypothetical protein
MLINFINKKNLEFKKDNYLKKLDGVSVVINRKISLQVIISVGKWLCEGARLSISVCRFFIEHPMLSVFLIQGTKGLFGIKNINVLKWISRVGKVGAGTTSGYEVASVKHQLGIHEILLESLKKDNLLGSVIESTKDIVDTNLKDQVVVAATSGLIAVSTGVVEPSVISTAMLMPYDAVKTVGKYGIMSAATGGGLGGVTLGLMGLSIGSYLAPDLMSKTVSLPQKMFDKIISLNTIKVETWYEKVSKGFQEIECVETFVKVKKPVEIVVNRTEIQFPNVLIHEVIEQDACGSFIMINNNQVTNVFKDDNGNIIGFVEFVNTKKEKSYNYYLFRFDKTEVGSYHTVVDLITNTSKPKEEVVTELVKKKIEIFDTVEKTKRTPEEMSEYTNLVTKSYKYSSEMLKIYIDNYTLTEHLIIIGSVSLISYGIYRMIKNYWKSPESVIDPSKHD